MRDEGRAAEADALAGVLQAVLPGMLARALDTAARSPEVRPRRCAKWQPGWARISGPCAWPLGPRRACRVWGLCCCAEGRWVLRRLHAWTLV